jgi:flagellar motor switch protein FliN
MPATEPGSGMTANLDLIMDIPIDVQIVLGTSRMQVSGLMNLTEGATIALDRKIGEPVEIVVNGRVIGRGEITVLDRAGLREEANGSYGVPEAEYDRLFPSLGDALDSGRVSA